MADKKETKNEVKKETTKKAPKETVKKETTKKPVAKKTDTVKEVKKETKTVDTKKKETKVVKEVKKEDKKADAKKADTKKASKEVKETKKDKAAAEKKVIEAKAILRHERISPSKVNIVAKLIRGKDVSEALDILRFTSKAASPILTKLIKSAIANAENNHSMDKNKLYISHIQVNVGPILKRMRPRARGSGFRINKRSSHIEVVLKERE